MIWRPSDRRSCVFRRRTADAEGFARTGQYATDKGMRARSSPPTARSLPKTSPPNSKNRPFVCRRQPRRFAAYARPFRGRKARLKKPSNASATAAKRASSGPALHRQPPQRADCRPCSTDAERKNRTDVLLPSGVFRPRIEAPREDLAHEESRGCSISSPTRRRPCSTTAWRPKFSRWTITRRGPYLYLKMKEKIRARCGNSGAPEMNEGNSTGVASAV